jgi:CRP-like cAMP-binding protein/Fe-S-cluster-containing hydrogenase component 2
MARDVIRQAELGGTPLTPEELAAIPSLSGIRKEIWAKFPGAVAKKTFAPGDIIFRQGESGTTAFLLISGTVEISLAIDRMLRPPARRAAAGLLSNIGRLTDYLKGTPSKPPLQDDRPTHIPADGNIDVPLENPIASLEAGDIFGELAALAALKQDRIKRAKFYPRSATARAINTVEVIEMLPNILNNVLYTSPAFKKRLNESYRTRALDTHLRCVPVFRNVPRDFLESIKQSVELADYQPGQVIYREGEAADAFYLIRLGFVKVSRHFPGGEMVLSYLSRGSYFGENGIVSAGLIVRATGPEEGQVREVVVPTAGVVSCGRSVEGPDTLSIPWDTAISRRHFELRVVSGKVRATKLVSGRNPLVYNSRALSDVVLAAGERFTVGDTSFEILNNSGRSGVRSATVTAMDFVQTVRIKHDEFLRILERHPDIAGGVSEVAQARADNEARAVSRIHTVSLDEFLEQDLMQGQDVLLLDLQRCVRCDECVDACAATHHDGFTRLIREGIRFDKYLVATSCRACLDPVCMTRCPVGSIRRKGTLDIVIEDWCIGCGNCSADCPYGAINIVPTGSGDAMRPKAAVCDLCAGYDEPNCVRACPHDAAIRVEPRSFFARDLAGVQLQPPAQQPRELLTAAAQDETRIHSNIVNLVALLPRVEVTTGTRAGDILQLKPTRTAFGRMSDVDYAFTDEGVSRLHCVILNVNGVFTVRDEGSTNGTFVNGAPVSARQLRDGDVIQLGVVEMVFLAGETFADRS